MVFFSGRYQGQVVHICDYPYNSSEKWTYYVADSGHPDLDDLLWSPNSSVQIVCPD